MNVDALCGPITPVAASSMGDAQATVEALAVPPGSLGQLGQLAAQMHAISAARGRDADRITCPGLLICAGDHGVVAQGVTMWPQEVTATMVGLFLQGKATCSALARSVGAMVRVLDVGVASELPPHEHLICSRVRPGTADLSTGPAMSGNEAQRAVAAGAAACSAMVSDGCDALVVGDMGIGNTTAAAIVIGAMCQASAARVTGPGAASDAATMERKRQVVADALAHHALDPRSPAHLLAQVGGLEHAAIVGAILCAAHHQIPVILDGVNTNAAALIAVALSPACHGYLVAGHLSAEPGAQVALQALELDPVVQVQMALGEGTGGLLAVPIVQAACELIPTVARLSDVVG